MKQSRLDLLWNAPLRNPTQNYLRRFERAPWGEMKTAFSESRDAFSKVNRDLLKTHYDDMWREQ
jgi:hypothetical protein